IEPGRKLAPRGEVDEARLLVAGNDVHGDPRPAADRLDELLCIRRFADGAGGRGAGGLRPRAANGPEELLDRGSCRLDGVGREPAGRERFAPETDQRLLAGQDLESPVVLDGGDEEFYRFGSDVDGGKPVHGRPIVVFSTVSGMNLT